MFSGIKLLITVSLILIASLVATYVHAGGYIASLPYLMLPTAHAAFALFFMAFSASSIYKFAPSPYSKWALQNRRYIGLSFALVHTVHLVLVLTNITLFVEMRPPLLVLLPGALAYVFLFLMASTSNNASIKKLGTKNWKRLHTLGSWYIWAIFISALPEVFSGKYNRIWIFALCFVVLFLRIKSHRMKAQKAA